MKHKESDLQIRCIKWFRYQYPAFARLMEHPHNEGNAFNARQQSIANAEGVTKGVADLILHMPATSSVAALFESAIPTSYHSLAIEMKTPTGRQSPEQRRWQRLFEASGGRYVIVRSYEDFVSQVGEYVAWVPERIKNAITNVHASIQREADEKAKEQFRKILNKQ